MRVFSATDVGQLRKSNEDYIFTSLDPVGNLPNLFVVADGMGGHNAGEVASHLGVSALIENIKNNNNFNPVKIVRSAVSAANRAVFQMAASDEALSGMGTTMVVASVSGDWLYVANVGDSRLYHMGGDFIKQVTMDHSLIAEMVRIGELSPEEGKNHPDKNIITRAIGTAEKGQTDFFDLKLESGQQFVMCSDGLSNMVEDEDILRIVRESLDAGENPAAKLVDCANANGGRDNISVIVVDMHTDEVSEC